MTEPREYAGPGDPRPTDDVLGPDLREGGAERRLGDFTATPQVLWLVLAAVGIGVLSALVALLLLGHRAHHQPRVLPEAFADPDVAGGEHPRPVAVLIPVAGGLIVGLMARYGSERIRGHGIPEAMETILVGGSKSQPRVMVLKPISSAVSIGSGGPFGAEGPIILTGGALGSVFGQFFHLTAIERRSLLVAARPAGMSAVFGTPVAAVLLGVELLVFEWKPRSLIPIVVAPRWPPRSGSVRRARAPAAPSSRRRRPCPAATATLFGGVVIGLLGGATAWVLTKAVYGAEDAFNRLPIHWAWWPAIGGVVVGIGGLIEPRALGVGYDTIADELGGRLVIGALISILIVKLVIWSLALGSGTSGGILAPILIMGAAVGGLVAPVLPGGSGRVERARHGCRDRGRHPLTVDRGRVLARADGRRWASPAVARRRTVAPRQRARCRGSILTEKVARAGSTSFASTRSSPSRRCSCAT